VTCAWFVKGGLKSESFPAEALKIAHEPRTLEQMVEGSMKVIEGEG